MKFFFLLFLLIFNFNLFAYYELGAIKDIRDIFYSGEKDYQKIENIYSQTVKKINLLENESEKNFLIGVASYYMGRSYQLFKDSEAVESYYKDLYSGNFLSLKKYNNNPEKAEFYLSKAEENFDKILKEEPENIQVLFMLTDTLRAKGLVDSLAGLASNNYRAKKFYKKGISIDEKNIKGLILEAFSKTFPPKGLGGNPLKAIEEYNHINTLKNKDREDIFKINLGLGFSYFLLQDYETSEKYLLLALKEYDNNFFATGYLCMAKKKVKLY